MDVSAIILVLSSALNHDPHGIEILMAVERRGVDYATTRRNYETTMGFVALLTLP
jgi:hypothetical protein